MTVRGLEPVGNGTNPGKAALSDFKLNSDLHVYLDGLGEDKEISDRVVRTNDEAKDLAKSTMRAALKSCSR